MNALPDEPSFADLLKHYRRDAGHSQEALAERAGLSVGAIASLEQGARRAPHRVTVDALAKALGIVGSSRGEFEHAAARARHRIRRDEASLPQAITSFVERNEVEELAALLPGHRLITVTGPGGVGKTRIAIEVARRSEDLFDIVTFVDLLPLRDGDMVTAYVASRLNVAGGPNATAEVVRFFQQRRALLVVDNCEHVVAEAAELINTLLRRCSALTILATSREALTLSAELAYRLPSMDVAAACMLFVTRAGDPNLATDAKRLAVVAGICRELDCIPLAIELAASRASALGVESLHKRLKSGMALVGSRDLPQRHQTMEATISWSYDLLNEKQRQLFEKLSVFCGSFTLDAAESVCSDEGMPPEAVADGLIHLVQKSLINLEPTRTAMRYRFLDAVRAFARERLSQSTGVEKTMLRLIEWLTQRALILETTVHLSVVAELSNELDEVAAAISWAISTAHHPTIGTAARLFVAFRRAWIGTSRQMEFRDLGLRLLECLNDGDSPELVGLLIHAMSSYVGDERLLTLASRAIPLLVGEEHHALAAELHVRCAAIESMRGNSQAAKERLALGDALLSINDRQSTRAGFAFACTGAYVRCSLQDYGGAKAMLSGLRIPPGDPFEVDVQIMRAMIEFDEGRVQAAVDVLSWLKPQLDRYPQATSHTIYVCGNLAEYHLLLDNPDAAESELREAVIAAMDVRNAGDTTTAVVFGKHAALLAARSGRIQLAAKLLGASDDPSYRASSPNGFDSAGLAAQIIEAHLPAEHANMLRRAGANEGLYELFEEFLAQPAMPATETSGYL